MTSTEATTPPPSDRGVFTTKGPDARPKNDVKPGFYIFLGTIGWSLAPLIIEISDAGLNPFAFYIWYGLGTALGTTLFLFFYVLIINKEDFNDDQNRITFDQLKKVLTNKDLNEEEKALNEKEKTGIIKKFTNQFWHSKILSWGILGRLSIAFLALASGFVETEVATVLYEAWVIFYLIIRSLNDDKKTLKSELSIQNILLFTFAAIGLLFINLSETGKFSGISILGLVFSLTGAILAAISLERSIKWGETVTTKLGFEKDSNNKIKTYREIKTVTVYTLVATIVMNFAVAGVSAIGVVAFNWGSGNAIFRIDNYFYSGFAWVFIFAIILGSLEIIGYRKGGLETSNNNIFAIAYFMPVFSIIWLWVQDAISEDALSVQRIDYFLIGISIVVAINILLNYSIDKHRLGFRWLVLSFWVSGVVILLRDQWFSLWHGFDNWLWEGSTDYYAVLGLSTTVFVLVLSFRTIRINERTRHENSILSSLYWKLWLRLQEVKGKETYAKEEKFIDKALKDLKKIDASETVARFDAKNLRTFSAFRRYYGNHNNKDLADIYRDFDEMVHSKSAGRDVTEPLVLIAFGASTILLTLVTRPQFSNWNLFVSDSFSVLFSATIAFMIFNLFDLRKERSTPMLWTRTRLKEDSGNIEIVEEKKEGKPLDEWIDDIIDDNNSGKDEFDSFAEKINSNINNSKFEMLFSFFLAAIIVIIFLLLLYGKWIVDWNWTSGLLPDYIPKDST